ncbi:hypothetical protein J6590_101692 [Homalodisca vitripennis]|nr:hypothetical protein J6590_101692 [Homalodisca vitripennis]
MNDGGSGSGVVESRLAVTPDTSNLLLCLSLSWSLAQYGNTVVWCPRAVATRRIRLYILLHSCRDTRHNNSPASDWLYCCTVAVTPDTSNLLPCLSLSWCLAQYGNTVVWCPRAVVTRRHPTVYRLLLHSGCDTRHNCIHDMALTTGQREVAWPSGLRRWFKAPVSSEAWVRIPPLPLTFYRPSPQKVAGVRVRWNLSASQVGRQQLLLSTPPFPRKLSVNFFPYWIVEYTAVPAGQGKAVTAFVQVDLLLNRWEHKKNFCKDYILWSDSAVRLGLGLLV